MSENRNKIQEKMNNYLDDEITSLNYRSEQMKEKLQLRKKKIFDILISRRKEAFLNDNINDSLIEIDINKINCDEEIKIDVNNFIKRKFKIKNWFKYLFSSNKNDNKLALFLIRKYIELQIKEIEDINNRKLSRNDTELIQRLCDNLLNDDIKIIYNSCACLTNLTLFPINIENRIYSERNLEKIVKFFNVLANNISLLGHKSLFLFYNICFNENVKIYLIKNSFLEYFYKFICNFINNQNNINEKVELNIIKYFILILSKLISVCDIDDNYINKFLPFIPICKLITSKFYANVNNLIFDKDEILGLIFILKYYSKGKEKEQFLLNEIIKDNFFIVLVQVYYKANDIKIKIEILDLFSLFLSIGNDFNKILINEGIIKFLSDEIERHQYSNAQLLNKIIISCSNLVRKTLGQTGKLYESGMIFKIIDITSFYINDNLDKEIKILLINCINCLADIINNQFENLNTNILNYNKYNIFNIFCKSLKMDLDPYGKKQLAENVIYAINGLNVASEELEPQKEKEYDFLLIQNSLEELLNNYYEKNYLDKTCKLMIDDIKTFIKDLGEKIL